MQAKTEQKEGKEKLYNPHFPVTKVKKIIQENQ